MNPEMNFLQGQFKFPIYSDLVVAAVGLQLLVNIL